jgi:hypothetical protein
VTSPSPLRDADAWHTVTLEDVKASKVRLPPRKGQGIAVLTTASKTKTDTKKAAGKSGATVTKQGKEPFRPSGGPRLSRRSRQSIPWGRAVGARSFPAPRFSRQGLTRYRSQSFRRAVPPYSPRIRARSP